MKNCGAAANADINAQRDLLRFLTCGSVDDGKSTLIGRLLHDTSSVPEDHMRALIRDSARFGTTGDDPDFALLLDGLEIEREQGITVDVGYRYFGTPRRAFIAADTPGHEQYTRNMVTGASTSNFAILLVDARKGLLMQTRRHSTICSLLGIRHVTLAVNKIDLVDFRQTVFDQITKEFKGFATMLNFLTVTSIPVSGRFGDNVGARSDRTPWYSGPTLLEHLERVNVTDTETAKPLRFAVQWINRPHSDFRGYSGVIGSGTVRVGDCIISSISKTPATVSRILGSDGECTEAQAGDPVTLVVNEQVDFARGDLLTRPNEPADVADQFAAHVVWMNEEPLLPGRTYLMRIGTHWTTSSVSTIKYRLNVPDLGKHAGRTLALNEIGFCNMSTSLPIAFDSYEHNRTTGAFILVDRFTYATVAAGMIAFPLRRATNLRLEQLAVDKPMRAALKRQRPCVVWLTGLSGAGKSTIGKALEAKLHGAGYHTYMLDGDNMRTGLNRDLGFTDADRVENIRRAAEVARLMADAGLIIICAFISPFEAERQVARELCGKDEFVEVFVSTTIDECVRRDPKGLYAKALAGTIQNFTGFDSEYQVPVQPDLVLETEKHSVDELVELLIERLRDAGRIGDQNTCSD